MNGSFNVNVTVRNTASTGGNLDIQVVDNASLGGWPVNTGPQSNQYFSPGQTRTFSFSVTANSYGTQSFKAQTRVSGHWLWDGPSASSPNVTATAATPTVQSVTVSTTSLTVGQSFQVNVTVQNTGTTAGSFDIPAADTALVGGWQVNTAPNLNQSFSAGQTRTFSFSVTANSAGTHSFNGQARVNGHVLWDGTSMQSPNVTATTPVPAVATPAITPNGGIFIGSQRITLACPTTGATIYYTTNGTTPTTSSTVYGSPFTLNDSAVVEAMAALAGYNNSAVAAASFFQGPQTPSTVTGKILDSSGKTVLGATVQIGTAMTTSASDGSYSITGLSAGSYPVTVSAAGYMTLTSILSVTGSSQKMQPFTLTVAVSPPSGNSGNPPIVASITTQYSPNGEALYFLNGVAFPVTFTATVNWGNNHTPGIVNFITPTGTSPVGANGGNTASATIDVGSAFGAGGQLQVQAVSGDGSFSVAKVANFLVMSPPIAIPFQVNVAGRQFSYLSTLGANLQFINDFLPSGLSVNSNIPLFGDNPIGLKYAPSLEATINGSAATFDLSISTNQDNGNSDNSDASKPFLNIAGLRFDLSPEANILANYNQSTTSGPWIWGGNVGIIADLQYSPPAVYLPVPIPVPVYARVAFDLSADADLNLLNLDPVTLSGTAELNPSITGTLGAGIDGLLAVDGWLTGGVDLTFQYPPPANQTALIYYQLQISGGVTVYAFLFTYTDQLFEWNWPATNAPLVFPAPLALLKQPIAPRPYPREYLNQPSYGAFDGGPNTGFSLAAHPLGLPSGSPNPLLSALQTGVFPFSEPSISASGTNCDAVWLYDNPNRTANNRTMLVYSEFDGTNWSMFSPVWDDGTADFHPQLRTFADGSAVVAWENEGTILPTNADFIATTTNLEIATAFYDPVARAWQPMQQLTSNGYLNRSPLVAGPSETNLMLVWVENTNNDLEGSATNLNQLWFSTWNGSAWGTPQTFANVPYPLLKYDMTYDGTNAYVVMSLDADNALTNVEAHQLFEVAYQSGAWGGLQQLTTNQVPNDNPQMAVDPNGNVVLAWLQGNVLSSMVNFNFVNQQVVGTNQYSSNLGDFKLAKGSDGRLAIVWAAPSPQFSSDLWVMFYDPNFEIWGNPRQLTSDPETEMETAATFYSTTQLVALYDRADVAVGDTNQIINYGTAITNADLYVLQYQLTNNLALFGGSLIVWPPNPAPGATASLSVATENLGDSAVSNVLVVFYQGDPANGGTEIGETNIAVLMPPGASNIVSIPWDIPATTNPLTIYAVIDPYQQYPQSDLHDEKVNGTFVEPDLAIQAITWGPIASNLLSVTATVINDGTIASQPATVSFPLDSLAGVSLFSTNVAGLSPGQSVDVNFIWNVPSLGNGTNLFAVVNAGTNLDFNHQNNALEMMVQPNIAQVNVQFGTPTVISNGVVQIPIAGLAGQTYVVEVSTNQLNWSVLTVLTLTNGVGQIFDTSTNNFYQALVFSQAQPQLAIPQFLDGTPKISVTGLGGQNYVIEGSTDLITWTPIYTNGGSFMFGDSNATNFIYRFYRAVLP